MRAPQYSAKRDAGGRTPSGENERIKQKDSSTRQTYSQMTEGLRKLSLKKPAAEETGKKHRFDFLIGQHVCIQTKSPSVFFGTLVSTGTHLSISMAEEHRWTSDNELRVFTMHPKAHIEISSITFIAETGDIDGGAA